MDKIKILVVDDESRMRKLVRDFLVRQDYEVLEAVLLIWMNKVLLVLCLTIIFVS